MKAFAAAVVFAALVALGAMSVLNATFDAPAASAFATDAARVDRPGENLISY